MQFEKLYDDAILPVRSTLGSAGYDLFSHEDVIIEAHTTKLVKTGVTFNPNGLTNKYLGVHSRSGLALKKDVFVLNAVGVVDADYYPNEIGVILRNEGDEDFIVEKGDRIAQGVISQFFTTFDDNASGERNGGFGSTGN